MQSESYEQERERPIAERLPMRTFIVTLADASPVTVCAHAYTIGDHGAVTFCDHTTLDGEDVLFFRDSFAVGTWRRVKEVESVKSTGRH